MKVAKPIAFLLLMTMLTVSALAVIYSKYHSRMIFIEIQKLERDLDLLAVEWGRLQLELTTLAEQNRIERKARKEMGLVIPDVDNIVYVKP